MTSKPFSEKKQNNNYLVTGGIGFIGSNLCLKLLQSNDDVTVIDNYDDYYNPKIKFENLNKLVKFENFDLIECDILNYKNCKNRLNSNYDALIHLAAFPGVRNSFIKPQKTFDVNVNGTRNMCQLALELNIPKFVFASSSSVYGTNEHTPWSESDTSLLPISPYAKSKLKAELICREYHNKNNISFDILRFFSVYGQNQRPDLAILKFTSLIQQNLEIPFFGDGFTYRDYTHVDDIVSGIIKALNNSHDGCETFNIGSGKVVSLKELLELIEKYLEKKAIVNTLPKQKGDVNITYADITKAKNILGYEPMINIENGIKRFVAWYNKLDHHYYTQIKE